MIESEPVVVEQTFDAPIAAVWNAITDKDQMRQWFFEDMVDFEPKPGFETEFSVHCDGRDFVHLWKLTEVIPKQKIVYDWCYRGYPGRSTVVWELSTTPDGAQLKITHRAEEAFPQDDPVFSRQSCQDGWDWLIRESLKDFLERQTS